MNRETSRITEQSSRRLTKAEANAQAKLNRAMATKFSRLSRAVNSNWNEYKNLNQIPRQKAIALSKVLDDFLSLTPNPEATFRELYRRSQTEGVNLARNLLTQIGIKDVQNAATNDFVDFWTSDSTGRLGDWGKAFKRDAAAIFELGMGQGWTAKQVNDALLSRFGQLQQQAERIVRTGSPTLAQDAKSAFYKQNGITLVIWLTSLSDRVCVYCSPRHGNVYYIDDIVFGLHPYEQCHLIPLRRRNLLYDVDRRFLKQEKAQGLQQLNNAGGKPNYGLSPFEKKAGREKPIKPVWQPDKGYSYGEKSKTRRLVDE